MDTLLLTCPCNFGVEAVLKRELEQAGMKIAQVEDGRVDFWGGAESVAYANVFLRSAERVLVKLAAFPATTFEELYQGVKSIDWAAYLPKDACFPAAKAASRKSVLFSTSDIQAIVKKAAVDKMFQQYRINRLPETGHRYPIHIFVNKDVVHIYLDSSGDPLFKRGYRRETNLAPMKETLAYALTAVSGWRYGQLLVDPLCGSGTILIEAAMAALSIAPGEKRRFLAEDWSFLPRSAWRDVRSQAREERLTQVGDLRLQGYDLDPKVLRAARHNAEAAGVAQYIHFQQRDVRDFSSSERRGRIITNPPYGERLEQKSQARQLYQDMGRVFGKLQDFACGIVAADDCFEQYYGRRADKRRKLYNGMIKCTFYQYFK
ncbi:MAG: class I SAM-dependent RNA methyltransferase [Firmicutes bacterium]|nr:class I SAM-dependent RNA methyltransferase [Bacillota bacterium]